MPGLRIGWGPATGQGGPINIALRLTEAYPHSMLDHHIATGLIII